MQLRSSLLLIAILGGARALHMQGGRQESKGYVTAGFGWKYQRSAEMLCQTIKRFNDTTPFALVTSTDEAVTLETQGKSCFDLIVPLAVDESITLPHERYHVDPMVQLINVLPFKESIFLDSELLRTGLCDDWGFLRQVSQSRNQAVVLFGRKKDCGWHWKSACRLSRKLHTKLPHTHDGMIYIRTDGNYSDLAKQFFAYARDANDNYTEYGFLRKYQGESKVFEILLSYATAKMHWEPVEFAEQDLFCFNWKPGDTVPPRLLNVDGLAEGAGAERRYCHTHIFDENDHNAMYRMIMSNTSAFLN